MELLYEAYDRTVKRCNRLEWKYMDIILNSWYEKGLTTPDAVDTGDGKPVRPKPAGGLQRPSGQQGDAERQAMIELAKKYGKEN
jgi:hypothetical protein